MCEEVDVLSRQTCSVTVALLVNEQYLSSTSQLQGQNLVTQTSQPGSIFSAISINIPVTFLIIFAGLFGFLLTLITTLVIYVIKVNYTMKSQSHVILNVEQPTYNEISVAPNETTLQRTPSVNYYVEKVDSHRYIEMRPISRNEEADSADKEQTVYSDIPHPLKCTTVQKSSLISSNEGTVHFNHCFSNVDLYGCMKMTPTRTLRNSNSRSDLVDRSPRIRNSMVPRLHSNAMYFARDDKGDCKIHPYSYAE
ncbi:hypothetical protein HOLleu_25074 [Holothuria leucospilota]|uniref:Uncharacterized protein n=1 Tax=Holothuria leucospilota TaxID=206669 RepID=A0A9Q1H3R1_HOLLE|nr:hypothetical protein HOLleu_25074 [Holothuria leucospilota]